jgi:hypothetical protein
LKNKITLSESTRLHKMCSLVLFIEYPGMLLRSFSIDIRGSVVYHVRIRVER